MKDSIKKFLSLAVAMVVAAVAVAAVPGLSVKAQAASSKVYINPYSDKVVSYKGYDDTAVISIVGCDKKSQIKNLKSSNKNIKVEAKDGYICAKYGSKLGKTTITCTVKNVKLKTTLKVVKYQNAFKSIKLGNKNFTNSFKKINYVYTSKKFKNQKLSITCASGWKVTGVGYYNNSKYNTFNVGSGQKKFSATKISLSKSYSYLFVSAKNTNTGIEEYYTININ